MGYRGKTGSRRSSGEKFQKSSHEKAKSKTQKNKPNVKYAPEETSVPSAEEVAQKTLISLDKLGTQTFALSPYRQYYDDWLINLRQVLSEFESNPAVNVDDAFVKERTQMFADVEGELAKKRTRETELEEAAKTLAENNHLLLETDAQYATQTRELATKRNREIERLTKNMHDLEAEFDKVTQMRTSFFGFTKKAKAKKEAEATQKLNFAKGELEIAVQNFAVEQEKMHDEYEKKKQDTIAMVQTLEKEIVDIEEDSSLEARQATSAALANAVKDLLHRRSVPSQ
jgi:hypothetical protein